MALPNPLEAFVWGANGARLTPDQVAREREVADALLAQGIDTSPVAHPLQGLARVATAAAGAYRRNKADRAYATGREGATSKIAALLSGMNGTATAKPSSAPVSAAGPKSYRDAIASIESAGSGDYSAVGPTHPKMGRALGRYQIMESNIAPWSKEALGREVSAEEFMANPELQDAIFDSKFGGYVNQFGPEGAAQAWFAGPGGVGKTDRKDVLGTDVGSYGAKFMKALGNGPIELGMAPPDPVQVASLDPSVGMQDQFGSIQPGPATVTPIPDPSVPAPVPPQGVVQGQDITPDQWAGMRDPVQQVAQAMPQQAPVQVAQAGPSIEQLIEAASDPYLSDGERSVVNALLEQQMQQQDPLRQQQLEKGAIELEALRNPKPKYGFQSGRDGSIFRTNESDGTVEQVYGGKPDNFRTLSPQEEIDLGLDPAGAYQMGADNKISKIGGEGTTVNIDQRAEGAFEKRAAESQAEAFSTMASEGLNASADLAVINELDTLLKGQGGMGTGLMGWMAQRGIDVGDATSDLQAAQALINKLVPSQRQAGSGSMSDRDVELFTRSLPSLWNTPGGNEKIVNVMRGLAQYRADQGEIADMVITGEITRQEGRRMLRDLKNPLQGFKPPEKQAGGEAAKADRVQKPMTEMTDDELKAIIDGR